MARASSTTTSSTSLQSEMGDETSSDLVAGCRMISLKSGEGDVFKVSYEAVKCSKTIKSMIDDLGDTEEDDSIPVSTVTSDTLDRVIQWMEFHKDDKVEDYIVTSTKRKGRDSKRKVKRIVFSEWDRHFFEDVDHAVRSALIMAAHELEVPGLLDMCGKAIADTIKGKSAEEIRQMFNIQNDLPPGED